MADQQPSRATSAPLIGIGLVLAAVVIVAAFIAGTSIGWAVVILLAVCLAAALGYRLVTQAGGGDTDSSSSLPNQEPRFERPLGDTPEAHDEINPHDLPLDNPGREEAEEIAGGPDGTTRGPLPGG